MKAAIHEKFIQALESGEFKQGAKFLRPGDAYCVLGVLTELYRRENGGWWEPFECEDEWGHIISVLAFRAPSGNLGIQGPPLEVFDWAGIPYCPHIAPLEYGEELASPAVLNDKEGLSFGELAQLLRKQSAGSPWGAEV